MDQRRIPSITGSLEQSAKELGQGFKRAPHIKWNSENSQQQPQQPQANIQRTIRPQGNQQMPNPPNIPINNYDPTMDKFRKWLFYILTILIGGLAATLIVWRIALRFLS